MTAHSLEATALSLSYDDRRVISDLAVAIPPGKITVIVGANASGKSTLLRGLSRLLKPAAGSVRLDGRDIREFSPKQFARLVGLLPQQPTAPAGITVRELVSRGRYPHEGWFHQPTAQDAAAIADALDATSTTDLAARSVDELSGGQRQRVWIAMALAQDPEILLLDEPTTFLDIAHQVEVLDVLLERNRSRSTTIVMVLHDLNLAARYADRLVVMCAGEIIVEGTPSEVLTAATIKRAFELDAVVIEDPVSLSPLVVPRGRFH